MPRVVSSLALGAVTVFVSACGGGTSPTSPAPALPAAATPGMQVDPLRDAAAQSGKLVGAAVQTWFLSDADYSGVLARHFNYLTAEYEMKWDATERSQGIRDFGAGDAIVAYGQSRGMQTKGHALIWHLSVPDWIGALSSTELRTAFEDHIRAVAGHYRGRVRA